MADARVGTTPFQFRFYDWPQQQGGKAKPAVYDTWIYVFQANEKQARLLHEVHIQPAEGNQPETYSAVDLSRHAGKDERPVSEPGSDCCWLDDNSRHVLKDVRYYILCSPFQLPWKRIDKLAKTKDPARFQELATRERGLEKILLDEENTDRGPGGMVRIKSIWSPWGKCLSLSRQYLARLGEWEDRAMTQERQQQRTLLSAIDMLRKGRKGGKLVDEEGKPLLDEEYLGTVKKQLLEDDRLHEKVVESAKKLVSFFKGPAMTAMEDDAMVVVDVDAREAFAEIRETLEARLSETEIGREYRRDWLQRRHSLLMCNLEGDFKAARKGYKAIFNWVKSWADVAAGYPSGPKAGEVPAKLVLWSKKQVKWLTGRDLLVVETTDGWAMFNQDEVDYLDRKYNKSQRLNGLALMVDAINFALTVRSLFEGWKGDGWDKSKRVASGASSLLSLMSSVFAYAKSTTKYINPAQLQKMKDLAKGGRLASAEIQRLEDLAQARPLSRIEIARLRELTRRATLGQKEGALLAGYLSRGRGGRALSQLNRWRSATKVLGALGAAADTWSNGVDMFAGMHQAKVGDSSDRIWLWPGLGMVGSAIACAGYCLAFTNPAGAILIVAGSLMAAAGSIGGTFWAGAVTSDSNKWLMHCFVGRNRNLALLESDTYTGGVPLAVYHKQLDLQIKALDIVLLDFQPTCEIYTEHGEPRLKMDVAFRQLRVHSKVRLKVFGQQKGEWLSVLSTKDWRPVGAPPEDKRTGTREEMHARFLESLPARAFDAMKIAVQIDVLGDGSYLYPEEPKEALAKA